MSSTSFHVSTMANGARCLKLNEWNEKSEQALIDEAYDCISVGWNFGGYSKLEPYAENIRWLWSPSDEISLKDIGVLTNLERIDLVVGSEWEHFDYRDLPKLTTFRCKDAQKLNPTLLNCPTLQNLEIYSCRKLNSIELLYSLENIESMIIRGSPIKDLKGIEKFQKLTELRMANCRSLLDISALSSLPDLKILELYNNIKMQNLDVIHNLYDLRALFIINSRLVTQESLSYLSDMHYLKYVDVFIRTNSIDYDVLAKHRNIVEIGFFTSEGYKLPSLSDIKSKLECYDRKVEDIHLFPKDEVPALVIKFKPETHSDRNPKHARMFYE